MWADQTPTGSDNSYSQGLAELGTHLADVLKHDRICASMFGTKVCHACIGVRAGSRSRMELSSLGNDDCDVEVPDRRTNKQKSYTSVNKSRDRAASEVSGAAARSPGFHRKHGVAPGIALLKERCLCDFGVLSHFRPQS